MELERATNIIKAIPYMSKKIVDDTLYEKVLSFLIMALSTHSEAVEAFQYMGVFEQIKKACQIEDQDYRVITLSIRLLGQIVYFGKSELFTELQQGYPELLHMVTQGLLSSEPALRCSCLEACRLFVSCEVGQNWLSENKQATSFITLALLDQSHFVVSEACRLFSTLLILKSSLVSVLDPSDQTKSILAIHTNPSQVMAALELCWSIVNTKEAVTLEYLHQTQLLVHILPLLYSTNRMVRSRVLEIMTVLFSWDPNPIKTLNLIAEETGDPLRDTVGVLLKLAEQMISSNMDTLLTGVGLIEASIELLKRSHDHNLVQNMRVLLQPLLDRCCGKQSKSDKVALSLKSNRSKNNLLQSILRVLNQVILAEPSILKDTDFCSSFLGVFNNKDTYTDRRVLKSGLALLQTSFNSLKDKGQIIRLLVDMMNMGEFDASGISLLLDTFDVFLNDQYTDIEMFALDTWVETLNLKFLDPEWDVRDASIHFVGQLFKQPNNESKISFALKYNLPLSVLSRINDTEPYVRASAVDVLQNMMKSKRGWDYIQQYQESRYFLASQLPGLLRDTEAFVRRSSLDAICCLIENRSCQGMEMEIENKPNSLNPEIIKALVDDQDPDVRVRGCILIESLWYLYKHEMQQSKKREGNSIVFFHYIQAAELLVESANDTHRLVRAESVRIIENILKERDTSEAQEKKRALDREDEFEKDFLNKLSLVNVEQQKQTLNPEHLYEEAFDINVDMMTNHRTEDDILDCE